MSHGWNSNPSLDSEVHGPKHYVILTSTFQTPEVINHTKVKRIRHFICDVDTEMKKMSTLPLRNVGFTGRVM